MSDGPDRDLPPQLIRSEGRLEALVASLAAVVWEADATTLAVTFVGGRAEELLGYPLSRWVNEAGFWAGILHPDDRDGAMARRRAAVEERADHVLEYRVLAADGRVMWLRDAASVVDGPGQGPILRGLMFDVTEHKQAERRREAHQRLSEVLASAGSLREAAPAVLEALCRGLDWSLGNMWLPAGTGTLRRAHTWTPPDLEGSAFDQVSRTMAVPAGEGLPGRVWASGRPVWVTDKAEELDLPRARAAAESGLHGACAVPVVASGRTVAVLELFSREVRLPDEHVPPLLAAVGAQLGQFIERERAEEAASFHDALLRSQQEATLEGILVLSPDGESLSFNQRLLELWGVGEEEAGARFTPQTAGWLLQRVVQPDRVAGIIEWLAEDSSREWRGELELRDGRTFECFSAPLGTETGPGYGRAWYFRDISHRKRVERALAETSDRFASLARTLQQSLLPPSLPRIPGLELAAVYRPAGEGAEIGGDFYDVFGTGRRSWALVIGDVCGKGAGAASLTALARYTVRAGALAARKPSRIVATLNEALVREGDDERYCTVAYARVRMIGDSAEVTVTCGGHPLPMLIRADGTVAELGQCGTAIGLFGDVDLTDVVTTLHAGEALLLYTDGLTDAEGKDGPFGYERLRAVLADAAGLSAEALVRRVEQEVMQFREGPLRDDVTMLALRVVPS